MTIEYPTRCRIIDVEGETWRGLAIATPDVSRPHIGKEGLAELLDPHTVRITLDDGTIIYGAECWWESLEPSTGEAE